jgi:hypothetical protein
MSLVDIVFLKILYYNRKAHLCKKQKLIATLRKNGLLSSQCGCWKLIIVINLYLVCKQFM